MKFRIIILGLLAGLASAVLVPGSSQAVINIQIIEDNGNVIVVGKGDANLDGLSSDGSGSLLGSFIAPLTPALLVGPASETPFDRYTNIAPLHNPIAVGSGAFLLASAGSGDLFGFGTIGGDTLFVPAGYGSGDPLHGESTFANATFTSLGLTPGHYQWEWGSGANADSLNVCIGTNSLGNCPLATQDSATPVPGPLPVFGAAAGLAWSRRLNAMRPHA